jgi:peptide/nickel transport system permease protein
MAGFVLRRLASVVVVLLAVSILVFLIFQVIPAGDPAERMAGRGAGAAQVEAVRREWGFDHSLPQQYLTTMRKALSGDLVSYTRRVDVDREIIRRLPATLSLALGAAVLSLLLGVAIGVAGALRAGRLADRLLGALALLAVSAPVVWLGAMASHYLGFRLGLLPGGGYVGLSEDPLGWAQHLVLPWLVLSALFIGLYSRVLRAAVLSELEADHVVAARARGIPERQVLRHHVLRTALLPVVPLVGLDLGAILGGGAILTEAVFDLGGVGQFAAGSVARLDLPSVLAVTLFGAVLIVLINALAELAAAALDPRLRAAR